MICTKMGVINLTPNSFSDGSLYNNKTTFLMKFRETCKWADWIDLGAESTAPFNDAISFDEEMARFEEVVFSNLSEMNDPKKVISIDTYRLDTFMAVEKVLKAHFNHSEIVWNDVSGSVDDELLKFIRDYKNRYVFCHNLCDHRSQSSDHMSFLSEASSELFLKEVISFFKDALQKIKAPSHRIILDPCFGFSKTKSQNLYLLKEMNTLINEFKNHHFLYGISRKSFLRFKEEMNVKKPETQALLDMVQGLLIQTTVSDHYDKLIFRTHNHEVFEAIEACHKLLS